MNNKITKKKTKTKYQKKKKNLVKIPAISEPFHAVMKFQKKNKQNPEEE